MVSLSFKDPDTFREREPRFFPEEWTWKNYDTVFSDSLFTSALRNSFGISIIATAVLGDRRHVRRLRDRPARLPAARRCCCRWRWRSPCSRRPRSSDRCSTCGAGSGIYDTWIGLIIPYLTFALPLSIWTMSAFFRQIPWEMEQAAQVDGATAWQAFRKVIVPLAAPGVFTTAILTFFFCWNEFLLAAR